MLRYAMTGRWIGWHLLCSTLVITLVSLGVWQWQVSVSPALSGEASLNFRNLVYALQWWVFAAFGTWFWWRYIRDQRDAELATSAAAEHIDAEPAAADADSPARDTQPDTIISLDAPAHLRLNRASDQQQ